MMGAMSDAADHRRRHRDDAPADPIYVPALPEMVWQRDDGAGGEGGRFGLAAVPLTADSESTTQPESTRPTTACVTIVSRSASIRGDKSG
jgi:hypothetical protein